MCIDENVKNYKTYFKEQNLAGVLLSYANVAEFIMLTGNQSSLLLGNGFSLAYDKQNFSLQNLTHQMVDKNSIIGDIFKQFPKTNVDIEETMRIVNDSKKVLECFYTKNSNPAFVDAIKELKEFSTKIKKQFIKKIQSKHNKNISDNEKISARCFLSIYNKIFTLNYDLLLYWVISYNDDYIFSDGFGKDAQQLLFKYSNVEKPLFYLHGALHLFCIKGYITKLLATLPPDYGSLLEQIKNKIENDKYPICVTAGNYEEKKEIILSNYYLKICFNKLCCLGDYNLVIFGTYLKDNDKHIREAILNSKIKNVFFGVSDYGKVELFKDFIDEAKTKGKDVFFYNYNSVDVWGNKSNTLNHNNNNTIGI